MLSRPPPPRGYKYNPVNGKLEKKPKGVRTVGRGHNKKRKRRKTGQGLSLEGFVDYINYRSGKKSKSRLKKGGKLRYKNTRGFIPFEKLFRYKDYFKK